MEILIENYKTKGAIKEINRKIENIVDGESFMSETTTIGDYPEKRSFIKIPKGKEIIMLAKAIIEIVEDYYEVKK